HLKFFNPFESSLLPVVPKLPPARSPPARSVFQDGGNVAGSLPVQGCLIPAQKLAPDFHDTDNIPLPGSLRRVTVEAVQPGPPCRDVALFPVLRQWHLQEIPDHPG